MVIFLRGCRETPGGGSRRLGVERRVCGCRNGSGGEVAIRFLGVLEPIDFEGENRRFDAVGLLGTRQRTFEPIDHPARIRPGKRDDLAAAVRDQDAIVTRDHGAEAHRSPSAVIASASSLERNGKPRTRL